MNVAVKANTPERLKLILSPSTPVYIGFGLLFLFLGVWVIHLLGKRIELSVNNGVVHFSQHGIPSRLEKEFSVPAGEVTDVSLVLRNGWISAIYILTIHTTEKDYETYLPLSDGDEKERSAAAIRDAIAISGGTFFLQENAIPAALLLGGTCIIGGVICLYVIQTVVLIGDRNNATIRILRRRRFFPTGDETSISFSEYRGVGTTASGLNTSSGASATSYQVVIRMAKGKSTPLARGPMFTKASAKETATLIENWMERY